MPTFIKPDNIDTRAKGYKNWFNLDLFVKKIIRVFLAENPPISIPNNLQSVIDTGNEASFLRNNSDTTEFCFIRLAYDDNFDGFTNEIVSTYDGINQSQGTSIRQFNNNLSHTALFNDKINDILTSFQQSIKPISTNSGDLNDVFNLLKGDSKGNQSEVRYNFPTPQENTDLININFPYKTISGDYTLATTDQLSPQGKITITDIQQQAFADLATAIAWVNTYTSAVLTDTSFSNGVFKFTVPENTAFNLNSDFCSSASYTHNVQFEDFFGLISIFNDYAFTANTQNNILGNINVGFRSFRETNPSIKNTIKQIVSCGNESFLDYTGRIDIKKFGIDSSSNLPTNIFNTSNLMWINTPYSNKFNNNNALDGDLVNILSNMGNPNSTIIYN